ncbi:liver-expressed antimicrobial peptide 2 [Castor canadensis]|uniref:Liver-expressed antimicrobial peptide 2 n=2 Tax=Castor canadensis TaxID=51338 RepID=A0A8B7VYI7_CASCN|nr:liver-expressed antimicrobial peptide 2 [Castor canadensis]
MSVYKRKWERSPAFRLQHSTPKMWHLKLLAALMICLLLLGQVDGSTIPRRSQANRRSRRMTPFWRGVSLRPIGASCRDDSECITKLCRKRRCSLIVAQE